jgi:hypothetical protein
VPTTQDVGTDAGLLFLPSGTPGEELLKAAAAAVARTTGARILTSGAAEAYARGTAAVRGARAAPPAPGSPLPPAVRPVSCSHRRCRRRRPP